MRLTVLPTSKAATQQYHSTELLNPNRMKNSPRLRLLLKGATSGCAISTLAAPGYAENRGGSGAPFVVPGRQFGRSCRQGYAIPEFGVE